MERVEWVLISSCWLVTVLYPGPGIAVAYNDLRSLNSTYNTSDQNVSVAFADCGNPSLCNKPSETGENIGLAFGLTIGAGLATTLGALLPLIPCIRTSNTKVLAASLGFAAGVMVYVSFTELWQVSRDNFCCHFPQHSDLAVTIAFFTGIFLTVALDVFVWLIQRADCGCFNPAKNSCVLLVSWFKVNGLACTRCSLCRSRVRIEVTPNSVCSFSRVNNDGCVSLVNGKSDAPTTCRSGKEGGANDVLNSAHQSVESSLQREQSNPQQLEQESTQAPTSLPSEEEDLHARGPAEFREVTDAVVHDKKHLTHMGVLTGLAIAIHNFPEGVATFVASLSSLSLGGVLAFAIAIHNIPEGICVAMPIYYATGSKWKGIFWATLSGISEPVGALLAYVALRGVFSPLVYGICFGLISGMMVYIALKELLPTAYKFESPPHGVLVPFTMVLGMVVMAVSLLLLYL